MPQVIAIYPGTFDPITLGHENMVQRAATLFDEVVVAVAAAHHKKTLFSLEERIAMVREVMRPWPHVRVEGFSGLVRDFARQHSGTVMVRGVRSVTDFEYEAQLAGMNRRLAPEIDTVFLTPGEGLQHISSTLVREIAMLGREGEVQPFVSPHVLAQLQKRII